MRKRISKNLKSIKNRVSLIGFLLLLPTLFMYASTEDHHDPSLDRKMGERIFNGLIYGVGTQRCSDCHHNIITDSVSWNPSLYEISRKAKAIGVSGLSETLLKPSGAKLEVVHANYKLNELQLKQLQTYLEFESENPREVHKPTIYKILVFLFLGLLMAVALVDLFFTKKIKYKALHLIVIVIGIGIQFQLLRTEAVNLGRSKDYAPDQPIKFSHKMHAGDNKIDCMYCHSDVEKGRSAGIPSANVCMNCHVITREGQMSGKFEIAKVIEAMDSARQIEWIRVHSLPDHVFFDHSQHVKVGKVACIECHGDVAKMDIVKQEKDLSMGWCLDCHRSSNVKLGESGYYKHTFKKSISEGKTQMSVADMGGQDCMKCHY